MCENDDAPYSHDCPSEDLLERMVNGEHFEEAENHVSTCQSCQTRLESLGAKSDSMFRQPTDWSTVGGAGSHDEVPDYLVRMASEGTQPLPEIEGFQFIRELGRGGMAVAYLAKEIQLNRLVAIKILQSHGLASREMVDRFKNEAEATARLRHPNVVEIHGAGMHEDIPYIVLEYVDGMTLQEFMKRQTATPHEIAETILKAARGIEMAHQQNIIHRDIKPSNILLANPLGGDLVARKPKLSELVPKVADFGLARQLDQDRKTKTGAILGTPNYMSPEQVSGSSDLSAATDVYSLGVVLYELLSKRTPFEGNTPIDVFARIANQYPTPPSRIDPTVPADVNNIVMKCLEKSPADRYPSAADFADDLERFLNHQPVKARSIGPVEKMFRAIKKHPAMFAMVCGLVLLVLLWGRSHYLSSQKASAAAKKIDQSQYVTTIQAAGEAWVSRDRVNLRKLLDVCPPGLRLAEWQLLNQLSLRQPVELVKLDGEITDLILDPNLQFVVAACTSGRIGKYALDGSGLQASTQLDDPCVDLQYDPAEGQVLVLTESGRVGLWNLQDRVPIWLDLTAASCAAVSANHIASGTNLGELILLNKAGERLLSLRADAPIRSVYLASDSSRLLAVTPTEDVIRWDQPLQSPTPVVVQTQERLTTEFKAAHFSANGELVAMQGASEVIDIVQTASGQRIKSLFGHSAPTRAVAFSDKRCVTGGDDTSMVFWDLDGVRLLTLQDHDSPVTAIDISPQGSQLVSGDSAGRILVHPFELESNLPATYRWRAHDDRVKVIAGNSQLRLFATGGRDHLVRIWDHEFKLQREFTLNTEPRGIAWRPDSRQFAVAGDNGSVILIDLTSGELSEYALHGSGPVTQLDYSPDGKLLVAGGGENNRTVKLFDADDISKSIGALGTHDHTIRWLEFDSTGELIASCGGSVVQVWNAKSRNKLFDLTGHRGRVFGVRFDSMGKTLLTSGIDATVRIWDTQTGELSRVIRIEEPILTFGAFLGPDRVVLLNSDRLRIFDPLTGNSLLDLPHDQFWGKPMEVLDSGLLLTDKIGNLFFQKIPFKVD